jgi:hypothetical protein
MPLALCSVLDIGGPIGGGLLMGVVVVVDVVGL